MLISPFHCWPFVSLCINSRRGPRCTTKNARHLQKWTIQEILIQQKKNEEFSNKPVLFEVIQSTNFYVLARDLRIVSNGHLCFYAFEFQTSSLLLLYFLLSDAADSITQSQFISDSNGLWSTDVVGRVPHQSPTRLPTRRCCIWAFFFSRIHVESGSIRTDSTRIGSYQLAT